MLLQAIRTSQQVTDSGGPKEWDTAEAGSPQKPEEPGVSKVVPEYEGQILREGMYKHRG